MRGMTDTDALLCLGIFIAIPVLAGLFTRWTDRRDWRAAQEETCAMHREIAAAEAVDRYCQLGREADLFTVPPSTVQETPPRSRPMPDMQAVARGDSQAFAVAVAALASLLFSQAGSNIKLPGAAADVARKAADNGPQAGLLAAAMDLRALLAQSPQGRQALRDLGFEPILEHGEGE